MQIKTTELKDVCSSIVSVIENNPLAPITEVVEIKTIDNNLYINLTNKEYYLRVKVASNVAEAFHAVINANLFLKLISQMTCENLTLLLENNSLCIKGNGKYTLPLIYDQQELLNLPYFSVSSEMQFDLPTSILNSILVYNSKELNKGVISSPIQKFYYVDSEGALTFTSGACVNSFKLPTDIKFLLNSRTVKLFKLFKTDSVHVTIEESEQLKICFSTDTITLSVITPSESSLINEVPVAAIRGRCNDNYSYNTMLSKSALVETLNRMSLFFNNINNINISCIKLSFYDTFVKIADNTKKNEEIIEYENVTLADLQTEPYVTYLDINDLKSVIDNFASSVISIKFGNSQAVVVTNGNISNIIPECIIDEND